MQRLNVAPSHLPCYRVLHCNERGKEVFRCVSRRIAFLFEILCTKIIAETQLGTKLELFRACGGSHLSSWSHINLNLNLLYVLRTALSILAFIANEADKHWASSHEFNKNPMRACGYDNLYAHLRAVVVVLAAENMRNSCQTTNWRDVDWAPSRGSEQRQHSFHSKKFYI